MKISTCFDVFHEPAMGAAQQRQWVTRPGTRPGPDPDLPLHFEQLE